MTNNPNIKGLQITKCLGMYNFSSLIVVSFCKKRAPRLHQKAPNLIEIFKVSPVPPKGRGQPPLIPTPSSTTVTAEGASCPL